MSWGRGDNYGYLLTDSKTKQSILIDPSFPEDIKLQNEDVKLILNTHHHWDHSQGNEFFLKKYPLVKIIGGKDCPLIDYTPKDEEILTVGNLEIKSIYTPCHTQDSICYYVKDVETNEKAVFTGDTLFTCGCGRFFEGDAAQMTESLKKLVKLPKETLIYPGHEYTKSNVKFAKSVFTNKSLESLQDFTNNNEIVTGQYTIEQELQFNPFLRLTDPAIQTKLGLTDEVSVMKRLRDLKNKF